LDELAACVRVYREARKAAGQDAKTGEVALMRYAFVAESTERARAIAGDSFIRSFEETYFRWPHPVVKRPTGKLTIEQLSADRLILGDPASCVRQIERFQKELGLTHLICRISAAGVPREAARVSLDLFTREVMPAVTRAPGAGGAKA
jgi:alkanesulfonate monooxygenase SsuD/methylene tetrahydromethanopterin reductase-like flavin-dependent oxidoreductase (luciferase family)